MAADALSRSHTLQEEVIEIGRPPPVELVLFGKFGSCRTIDLIFPTIGPRTFGGEANG